jgi:hypothetical protein
MAQHQMGVNGKFDGFTREDLHYRSVKEFMALISSVPRRVTHTKQDQNIVELPALRIAAVQTRMAPVHHHDRGGAALRAKLGSFGEVRF